MSPSMYKKVHARYMNRVYCYPMPIIEYKKMLRNVYKGEAMTNILKWKLKDNYTYTQHHGSY